MKPTAVKKGVMHAPLTRIVLGIVVCFVVFVLAQQVTSLAFKALDLDKISRNLIKALVSSLAVVLAYRAFYQKYEGRNVREVATEALGKNVLFGLLLGLVLQCLTILGIAVFGEFRILAVNPLSAVAVPFAVALSVSIFEEVLMRGIIFRIAEEKLGSALALGISAVIFGLLHLANPNSTLVSGVCVVVAGVLFGLAYLYKRNLWFPIAIHFAWNFAQSGIFGAVTSGNEKTTSLLTTELSGNPLITGGVFGPEGSIQAIGLLLIASTLLYLLVRKQMKMPSWKTAEPAELHVADARLLEPAAH